MRRARWLAAALGGLGSMAALAQEPLHHWRFDGDLVDEQGGPTGTPAGNLQFTAGVDGQALQFDGSLSVSFANQVGNFGGGDYSIAFWLLAPPRDRIQSILSKRESCAYGNFWDVRAGDYFVVTNEVDGGTIENHTFVDLPVDDWDDGGWHHYVLVRKGAESYGYFDGRLVVRATLNGSVSLNNNAAMALSGSPCIGVDTTASLVGAVDDLQIYDEALDACVAARLAGWRQIGDVTCDACVDLVDLASVLADFGCASNCNADVNDDDRTDLADLAEVLANFGRGC